MKIIFLADDINAAWEFARTVVEAGASCEHQEGEPPAAGINVDLGLSLFEVSCSDDSPAVPKVREAFAALKRRCRVVERASC